MASGIVEVDQIWTVLGAALGAKALRTTLDSLLESANLHA